MADTFEQLLIGATAFKSGAEEATKKVLAALGDQAGLTSSISDIYKQQATDDVTIQTAKNAADQATQFAKVKGANAAGANLKDSGEVITALSQTAAAASERKQAAALEVERKRNLKFVDDPIEYIKAQFTVEGDIASHNAANAVLRDSEDRIMAVNAAAQATAQTQAMISEPLTAASMAASARNAAVAANVASKQAEIQALSYGTKGIEFALNASKDILAVQFQTQGAKNAQESLQLSRERAAQDKIEFKFRQQEYQDRKADKEDQQALGQSVVDTINFGRKALMQDKYTPIDDMSGKMVLATLKGKGTLSTEMNKFYEAGERSKLTGTVTIGTTPAQAAQTLQSVPVQLNPTQGAIKNLLGQAAQDTSSALKNADGMTGTKDANPVFVGIDKKDKSSIDAAYNGRAQQLLNEYSKVITPGDSNNPNQIASVNQLVANSPTLQALPVVQKVFAPLMKAGVQLSDPKQIVSLVGEAVASGKITHKDAVDLATVYHVGVLANVSMRNFKGFGLNPSYSYNARVETNPEGFSSTEVVDLTKPDAVSRALIKLQSNRLSQQTGALGTVINTVSSPGQAIADKLYGPASIATPSEGPYTGAFQPQPQAAKSISDWVDTFGK